MAGIKEMAKKEDATIIVDGFVFKNPQEAEKARKEAEGVRYIKSKVDMENPEMVLQIYKDMIRQEVFETEVGISYLSELQEYLKGIPQILDEDILPVPTVTRETEVKTRRKPKKAVTKKADMEQNQPPVQEKGSNYKRKFQTSLVMNVVLAVCIVCMFLINLTTNQTTILNYESKLIDKYESWEQELNERETKLRQQELELGITPDTQETTDDRNAQEDTTENQSVQESTQQE